MIRLFLLFCLVAFLGLVSLATRRSDELKADLRYVNPSGIHTLDPARMSWTQDFRVALNIWEGLTTWDPETLTPIAGAAVYPPQVSADGLTYVFTIRSDARWSNGDSVTASDFVRGWRRGLEPGTATDYTFLLTEHVAGAADYVAWRRDAVTLLTALVRLRDGWAIGADQKHAVAKFLDAAHDGAIGSAGHTARSVSNDAVAKNKISSGLNTPAPYDKSLNWGRLYEEAFGAHAAELDARFAEVGVKAIDPHTLAVRLSGPCPYFADLVALPVFLPCHDSVELLREGAHGSSLTAEGLVVYDPQWTKPDYHRNGYPGLITNGPYRLSDWIFKRRARLTANPFYHSASTLSCPTVDMLVYENTNAAIMAYEAGDVDFLPAMDVPYDHEIARLARTGARPDFHLCPLLATFFFNFNCTSRDIGGVPNPFLDRRVRQAFALAVDKVSLVNNVLRRGDRVARSFVPPQGIAGYDPPVGLRMDVKAAKSLLRDAGYPDGRKMPVVEVLCTPADARVCQAVARMWEETLGVAIDLRSQESKTFAEDKANQRFMIARGNWYADYNDPTTFLDCLKTGNGNNDSGYSNPEYDALLAGAATIRDRAARAELLRSAEAIIVEEDLPILPLWHYVSPIAIQPYIQGLHPNARIWFPFRYASVLTTGRGSRVKGLAHRTNRARGLDARVRP